MIKGAIAFFCGVCILAAAGCISFKIEPRPEPEEIVETFVLCKRVIPDGELLAPADIAADFTADDPEVLSFVKLKNIERTVMLKWKWYAPDERLFKETADVPVNEDKVYLETVTAYDKLDMEREENFRGRWIVVILIDGELAGRRTFFVR